MAWCLLPNDQHLWNSAWLDQLFLLMKPTPAIVERNPSNPCQGSSTTWSDCAAVYPSDKYKFTHGRRQWTLSAVVFFRWRPPMCCGGIFWPTVGTSGGREACSGVGSDERVTCAYVQRCSRSWLHVYYCFFFFSSGGMARRRWNRLYSTYLVTNVLEVNGNSHAYCDGNCLSCIGFLSFLFCATDDINTC